ncbi:MAG TPA: XRE family transcriptional regulator [Steroidobacteraceae bacterium]|jgi:transcriptional regulator with XRE-family HTH domain
MMDSARRSRLGATLRALRKQRGWTLAEVSRRTGFSIPTLSKVENDRLSLTYDKLIRLSEGVGIDIAQLFAPIDGAGGPAAITGRRSVNRRGEGELVATRNYDYRYLNTDVTRKKFIPIYTELHARSLEEFGELVRHTGEEFIYVLEGEVELHTELYAPIVLTAGESTYIDSTMGHAYVVRGEGPCRLLAVCSASEKDLREVTGGEPSGTLAKRPARSPRARRPTRRR